ncbi:alpha-2-macroglobulin family protein [Chloroflexota bacterium]
MKNHLRRFWGLYCSSIVVITLLCGGIAGIFVWKYWNRDASEGQVIPPSTSETSSIIEAGLGVPNSGQSEGEGKDSFIHLSEGQAQPHIVEQLPVATGEPLTDEEIQRILSRLPEIDTESDDLVDLNLPSDPVPPPRTGETISEPFPPPPEVPVPEPVATGPLEVLRYAPEGEIPIAPFINVTFNQPMVPLATVEDLAQEDVPVIVVPDLSGTWRWVGTQTLTFNYDSDLIDRLPMATEYRVTIPEGTQSATGGILAETVEFTFSTPPVKVVNTYPGGDSQPLEPILFVAFDQRITPQDVLDTIVVSADGDQVDTQLATEAEISADKTVHRLVESSPESRWLAFKTVSPLPKDADVSISIGPGTPSSEGLLLTQSSRNFSFRTYAPLKIVDHGCSWWDEKCPPLTPFYIEFNNPIDSKTYDSNMLRVEPEIPGVMVDIFGDTINIRGATQGQTTYTVFVSGEIQDIFGQKLRDDENLIFRVGPAEPVLIGPDEVFVTLDPVVDEPELSLYAINYNKLDVQIYAVQPSDWLEFRTYLQEYQRTDQHPEPPGRKVFDDDIRIEAPSDKLTEVGIGLSEFMDGDFGHFIVIAKPPKGFFDEDRYWETVQVWVQITQIGLDAFVDHSEMVVWTNALQSGAPLSDVRINGDDGALLASTAENGISRFPIPEDGTMYLVASQGADQALLPNSTYYWGEEGWQPYRPSDYLRWYVFDDRQMYRPGEEVHLKGWIRLVGGMQDGGVGLPGSALSGVNYTIWGSQGNELGSGRVDVNSLGGFDFKFTLPENANLGYAYVELGAESSLRADGQWYSHNFQIQEFRRPEFEVTARNETTGPYFAGGQATLAVEAAYFAGGPLPNAEVSWMVSTSATNYAPPNWPDFSFGIWQPWWWYYSPYIDGDIYLEFGGDHHYFEGITDATGNHYLDIDFGQTEEPRPQSVLAEATVMDVNRQAWAGSTSLMVHPADLYVGLHSEKYFVEKGTPLEIDLIVTDLDGNPVADRLIQVTAARLDWTFEEGRWTEVEVEPQNCNTSSQAEPVTCTFETSIGGKYQITALVNDEMGRQNKSQFTRWVSGGDIPPAREVEQETVTLIPDQESYQPGETAQILVQSPFSPAEGLMTISRSGLLSTERFVLEEGSTTLEIAIEEAHIPNLNLQIDLVGEAPRTDDQGEILPDVGPRPAYASGSLNLSIPPVSRTLDLEVTPRDSALEPGGETTIFVALKDADGVPIPNAELAVVVVDEAILALTNYQLADPVTVFYQNRPTDVRSHYSRASIVLVDPQSLADEVTNAQTVAADSLAAEGELALEVMEEAEEPAAAAPMEKEAGFAADEARAGGSESVSTPITVRMDFNPLATFAPEVQTDANGEARVEVRLPDNLTRYRIMVVAVDDSGQRFGSAESNLTARLPLMVRPSAPRFLNFGDNFELPIVLQNQTDETMSVEVVVQVSNLELTAGQGQRISVPANDRIEVRFPAAAEMAGTARVQIAAVSGQHADASEIELPVYTPATTEAFATYGVLDEGAIAQPVAAPNDVFPQFGGLEIQTSSTALQALTDAVLYLVAYPFECSEQLASRILGVAALRDVLSAFKADGLPTPEEMEAAVSRDIERLQGLQNYDGGFPYWRRGQESIPFNTIHVAHALQRAEQKNFDVPQAMQDQVLYYLQDIESYYPYWYSERTRNFLSSYALYVRHLMSDRDVDKARTLLNDVGLEELQLEAVGWLWQVLLDDPNSTEELEEIRRYINNRVVETPGAANFTTDYDDQSYLLLSSDRRTDAILLDALIADDPESDLIPKLVNGLLAHRTRGRWGNTQENVFVLLALDRYFNTFEDQTPDFVARIWLGDTYAGEHVYEGRTTDRRETLVPMVYLVDPAFGGGETQDLIISKEGVGRLYYRLGMSYAPTDLWLDPLEMGFVVQRVYEPVDDEKDVYRDDDGVWHIKAGAKVRVRITMVADNRRYHVALVDPLPAGLEIINPALAVSGSVPQDPSSTEYRYGWWWWGTWYEHQNMRDERAEAFTSLLWDGVYEYTYVARATTPGTFVVPPAKAEEMYSPEVFGRSGSDWVVVE